MGNLGSSPVRLQVLLQSTRAGTWGGAVLAKPQYSSSQCLCGPSLGAGQAGPGRVAPAGTREIQDYMWVMPSWARL